MKILRLQAITCALTLSVFSAAANATTFYFQNEPTTVTPNEIFSVDIFASLPNGLFSGGTDVFVDIALVTIAALNPVVDAASDPFFTCDGSGITLGCPGLNTLTGSSPPNPGLPGLPGSARFAIGSFGLAPIPGAFNNLFGTITVQAPATPGTINILGTSLQDPELGNVDPGFNPISIDYSDTVSIAVVPVPAAVWLFGSGLLGLVGVARRRKAA